MKEAIILAGGFGTRLKSVIQEIPKPMASVNDAPFLEYLLKQLSLSGFSKVILSVGYKHEIISDYFGDSFESMHVDYCVEESPLGTGGAIALAMKQTAADNILVLNGDSILLASFDEFYNFHLTQKTPVSIALKAEKNFSRYGSVILDDHKIVRFEEKKHVAEGVFSTGIYWFSSSAKDYLLKLSTPFSVENEIFEKQIFHLSGCVFHDYFIDIGVPEDYLQAQTSLKPAFEQYIIRHAAS